MATSPAERQAILADLSTLGIRDLVEVWRKASLADVDFAALILDAFPEIAAGYAGMAGDLAADWYTESAPDLPYTPILGPAADVGVLTKSAQWALGGDGDVALKRMSGTLQRSVFNGARETTLTNVRRERGATWARHASASACEFCRLLATRQDAYRSQRSAAFKAHDHCHCVAIESRPGRSYQPAPYVADWDREYRQARKDAGSGDLKQIISAWRQLAK